MATGGDRADVSHRTELSRAVVEAVAEAEGVPPEELRPPAYEPLHDVVDPEALDALFGPRHRGDPRPGGVVRFSFNGHDVVVDGDGTVRIE